MWIATKYEEVYPLRLNTLEHKIAHGKLTAIELKRKESEIIQTIGFQLECMSVLDRVLLVARVVKVEQHLRIVDVKYFYKVLSYLAKMIMYDYQLIICTPPHYLTTAILFVAFKIIEQLHVTFPTKLIVIITNIIYLLNYKY